jgi:hypothetical protein
VYDLHLGDLALEEHYLSIHPSSEQHVDAASAKFRDLVSCTVAHASLNNGPAYAALSYTWGDPKQTVPILVDGAIFMATINLEAALRHLRLTNTSLTLWIDALCIDQSNNIEKSEQLEQMRQIYEQASSVIAWLGPSAGNSDIALRWIEEYGDRSFELGIGDTPELRLQTLLKAHDANEEDIKNEKLRNFIRDLKEKLSPAKLEQTGLYTGLFELFKRPYWSRIWVVQELSSASKLLFRCGKSTMTDEALNHALRILRNFAQYQNLKHPNTLSAQSQTYPLLAINTGNPINLLKFRRAPGPFPIIHLLRSFRRFLATDPRDKLFALLGIARDAEVLGLHPDYTKSCDEVYTGLSRTLIQNGYLEVLALCEFPKNLEGLHSWVLDWSLKPSRSPLQQRSLNRSKRPLETFLEPSFSAAGKTTIHVESNRRDVIGSKIPLLLHAIFLGEVQETGTQWEDGAVGRWLLDLQRLSELSPSTSEISKERSHATWRTAVGDQELRQGPRKPRFSEEKIRTVHERLKDADMNVFDVRAFIHAGLGDYFEQLQIMAVARRPLLVSGDCLGIGPRETERGDLVFILLGGNTPYILRRLSQKDAFIVIGEAYVHGAMDGERTEGDPAIETITLH